MDAEILHLAARLVGLTGHRDAAVLAGGDRLQDAFGISAGRDRDEQVVCAAVRLNLLRENIPESIVATEGAPIPVH